MFEYILFGSALLCLLLAILFKRNPVVWLLWGFFLPVVSVLLLVFVIVLEKRCARNCCTYGEECASRWFYAKRSNPLKSPLENEAVAVVKVRDHSVKATSRED